jgi:ClpP class serine protease
MDGISQLFWLFLLFSSLAPMFQQRMLTFARLQLLRSFEKQRGSRVITLIHRQETMSLLGFPVVRYIDIEDSELVLQGIRLTPPDMPIDLIIHTPGGLVLAAGQIAHALAGHPGKVTIFVPHYAMSGGTLLALAADEILMDENAVLGPVDPQIGVWPAASIIKVAESKPIERVNDETLILADLARKAQAQIRETVLGLLLDDFPPDRAEYIVDELTTGKWTHDFPLTIEALADLGLRVKTDLPVEAFGLMELYPQLGRQRPSVQYVPIPYGERPVAPAPAGKD